MGKFHASYPSVLWASALPQDSANVLWESWLEVWGSSLRLQSITQLTWPLNISLASLFLCMLPLQTKLHQSMPRIIKCHQIRKQLSIGSLLSSGISKWFIQLHCPLGQGFPSHGNKATQQEVRGWNWNDRHCTHTPAPSQTLSVEKLSSTKLVPGANKFGNCCSRGKDRTCEYAKLEV